MCTCANTYIHTHTHKGTHSYIAAMWQLPHTYISIHIYIHIYTYLPSHYVAGRVSGLNSVYSLRNSNQLHY